MNSKSETIHPSDFAPFVHLLLYPLRYPLSHLRFGYISMLAHLLRAILPFAVDATVRFVILEAQNVPLSFARSAPIFYDIRFCFLLDLLFPLHLLFCFHNVSFLHFVSSFRSFRFQFAFDLLFSLHLLFPAVML
jgi:hypothetical protein